MSQIYIWDGQREFEAPHRKLFDFNKHIWTSDFLALVGQPLLCFGIEWRGSRRHGGWAGQYHLAYWGKKTETKRFTEEETCPICGQPAKSYYHTHEVEVGEDTIIWKERGDLATLRKELQQYVRGIQVDRKDNDFVIDQPPIEWDKIKPYYHSADKRLHFKEEEKLKLFIIYCWGADKLEILGKVATATTSMTTKEPKVKTRLQALKDELK